MYICKTPQAKPVARTPLQASQGTNLVFPKSIREESALATITKLSILFYKNIWAIDDSIQSSAEFPHDHIALKFQIQTPAGDYR